MTIQPFWVQVNEATPRSYGLWRGQVHMSDDFDVLPESIAAFAGKIE